MQNMNGDFDKSVGAAIRRARVLRGLTQQQLAKLLDVSFQQLQKYELGANRINFERLCQLSRIFAVPITDWVQDAPGAPLPAEGTEQHRQMLGLMNAYQGIRNAERRALLCALARTLAEDAA